MTEPEPRIMPRKVYNHLSRAEALVRAGEWSAADDCFTAAVACDVSPTSRIAFATSLAERERYHEAVCQMTAALDLAAPDGDREALSVIYHNLAAVYRELGDFDLAHRFQQCSIQQLDDCGSDELLGIANDAWLSKRRRLAESLAESSAELGDSEGPAVEAEATVGIMVGLAGDTRLGIRRLLQAFRTHRANAAYRMMGVDLLNLSILFGEIGRSQGEVALVQQAILCFNKASAPVSAARAERLLTTLMRVQSLRTFDPSRN